MRKGEEYSRNHFVPEYFLKQFTTTGNHFYVYNKFTDRINRKSSSQVCFEWNRNSLFFKNQERSTILEEKTYQYFDNKHSETFRLLSTTDFQISPWTFENVGNLELFIPLLYWRSPISDSHLFKLLDKTEFSDELGLVISQKGKNYQNSELHRQFLDDSNVRKAIRPCLIYNSFGKPHKNYDKLEWRVIQRNEDSSNIFSDNPIVFKSQPKSFEDFRGQVIMPLSNKRTLIRINENCADIYHNQLKQDIAIAFQAKQFVICSDKEYLTDIIGHLGKLDKIKVRKNYQSAIFKIYNRT